MSFVILACSDIRAQKVNLEFPFPAPPATIEDLRRVIEETFRGEEQAIKQANRFTDARRCEPFTISRLQKYNDDAELWEEVASPQMLQPYDQLYVFRKNTSREDIATERELPAPRRSPFFAYAGGPPHGTAARESTVRPLNGGSPSQGTASYHGDQAAASTSPYRFPTGGGGGGGAAAQGSDYYGPRSAAASAPRGSMNYGLSRSQQQQSPATAGITAVNPDGSLIMYRERTTPERVEYLFRFADQQRQGRVALRGFESIFRAADIRFPTDVVADLFSHFAPPLGGAPGAALSLEDLHRYAADFPVAVNVAYQRIAGGERAEGIAAAQREAHAAVEALQRQTRELEERLAAARRELQQQADHSACLAAALEEVNAQRDPQHCHDEGTLLDKEVSVFRYRERLSQEEQDYERLAMERRRRTALLQQQQIVGGGAGNTPVRAVTYGGDGRYGPV